MIFLYIPNISDQIVTKRAERSFFNCEKIYLPETGCTDGFRLFLLFIKDWRTLVNVCRNHRLLFNVKEITNVLILIFSEVLFVCGIDEDFGVSVLFEERHFMRLEIRLNIEIYQAPLFEEGMDSNDCTSIS